MTRAPRITLALTATVAAAIGLAACERPPTTSKQHGYRGLGMETVVNPRTEKQALAAVKVPDVIPAAAPGGQKASQVYKNVKVLGDLTENEFNRLMAAITEWVSPEQGCAYCHNVENLAEDKPYTKIVARRMLQMTRHLNETWKTHVGATGVTCYTCHAGKPVPENIWFTNKSKTAPPRLAGYTAGGQNAANKIVGSTSMTVDPFSEHFGGAKSEIRVQATKALPGTHNVSIQATEKTYALMIHMSEGLGVNCTFCHNSRSFGNWSSSTPQRTSAWHGIRMVRDMNSAFLDPLKPTYPANRLGPDGDAPKAFCSTCHQGLAKPLNGAQMLKSYLELNKATLR